MFDVILPEPVIGVARVRGDSAHAAMLLSQDYTYLSLSHVGNDCLSKRTFCNVWI